MDRTVVALFDDVSTAQRALEALLKSGFDRNDISIVHTNRNTADTGTTTASTADYETKDASGAAAGAGIGAVLGGIAGLVVGLGVLAIPGIGPVIAAGPLATTLAGAGIGAATGGIIGALTDVGIPEQDAGYYAEGIRRGGTLLTVRAADNRVNQATDILNRFSPVDVNQRASEWRSSGWTGYDPNASFEDRSDFQSGASTGSGGQYTSTGVTGSGSTYMAGTGGYSGASMDANYRRFDDFDKDFRQDWQNRYGSTGYSYDRYQPAYRYGYESHNRYQGHNWNDVESDLRNDWQRNHPNDAWEDFKDSVRTGWERFKAGVSDTAHDVSRGAENMTDDMRRGARDLGHNMERSADRAADDVRDTGRDFGRGVERAYDRTTSDMSRTFDRYDTDFRSDWERSYRSSGYDYTRFQPAYRYGYTLATENRYRGRDWNAIENDARRDWERQHPGDAWDDFKDAVQHAWRRVRADVKDALD